MHRSRRAVLATIGSGVAVALAGCSDDDDELEEEFEDTAAETTSVTNGSTTRGAVDFEVLLEYIPAIEDERATLQLMDMENLRLVGGSLALPEPLVFDNQQRPSRAVQIHVPSRSKTLSVLDGDVGLSEEGEHVTQSGVEYELYTDRELVGAAVDGQFLVTRGRSEQEGRELLEEAIAASARERARYVTVNDGIGAARERFTDLDTISFYEPGVLAQELELNSSQIEFVLRGARVHSSDRIEIIQALQVTREPLLTEERVERLRDVLQLPMMDGEFSIDGSLATVSGVRETVTAAEREIDSPRGFSIEGIEGDSLLVEIRNSDEIPVNDLELRVGDRLIDRGTWAGDQFTIEGGDTVAIPLDAVEPNTELGITHNHEYGQQTYDRTLFTSLPFEYDYDLGRQRLTLTYHGEIPIDTEDLYVLLVPDTEGQPGDDGPDSEEEPSAVHSFDDERTLTSGDSLELADIEPAQRVVVTWREPTTENSIDSTAIDPPGEARIEYDSERNTATVQLTVTEELPASSFELRIDGGRTDQQFSDLTETLERTEMLVLEGVEPGAELTLVWTETELTLARRVAVSDIDLAVERGDDSIEVTYERGPTLPVEALELRLWGEHDSVFVDVEELTDSETVESGETLVIDEQDLGVLVGVVVLYGDQELLVQELQ